MESKFQDKEICVTGLKEGKVRKRRVVEIVERMRVEGKEKKVGYEDIFPVEDIYLYPGWIERSNGKFKYTFLKNISGREVLLYPNYEIEEIAPSHIVVSRKDEELFRIEYPPNIEGSELSVDTYGIHT
ncbi:MAG: hypothetical protein QW039_04580 [Fervidicoccaceae archaeon]